MKRMQAWHDAILFPHYRGNWQWPDIPLVGLPALVRVLVSLERGGIQRVFFTPGSEKHRAWLDSWAGEKNLPELRWWDVDERYPWEPGTLLLGVQGGILFEPDLLNWFGGALNSGTGKLCVDGTPFLNSFRATGTEELEKLRFEDPAREQPEVEFKPPQGFFFEHIEYLVQPGHDRKLLDMVGKSTDRCHVRWIRRITFPAMRWLAEHRVRPNQITWAGFVVGIIACVLIAAGGYWSALTGAAMLYLSWILDCMDGTLARLTFAESRTGQRLDTRLGHMANVMVFAALIFAVYIPEAPWKAVGLGTVVLGGIILAGNLSKRRKTWSLRRNDSPSRQGLRLFLDKINHRDYALVILLMALVGGFKIFLWIGAVGIQIYWILQLGLVLKDQQA